MVLIPLSAQSQNNKDAKKNWEKAIPLYDSANYSKCLPLIERAIRKESELNAAKQDSAFIIRGLIKIGDCYRHLALYDSSLFHLKLGTDLAYQRKDTALAVMGLMHLNKAFDDAKDDTMYLNFRKLFTRKRDKTAYNMTRITSVVDGQKSRYKGDTLWLYCAGGSVDGVFEGAGCGFHAIYKPKYRERPFHYYGGGQITYVYNRESYGYVVLQDDFLDTVYKTDGLYVQMNVPETSPSTPFYDLCWMGYKMYNQNADEYTYYQHQTTSYYYLDPFFQEGLLKTMLHELHVSPARLKQENYLYLDTLCDGGRFNGRTIGQALSEAEMVDLLHYLNNKTSYRSKNFNREESLLNGFINWVYAGTGTGNNERVLWNFLYQNKVSDATKFCQKYYAYYRDYKDLDSIIGSWIDTVSDVTQKKQIAISEIMLEFAKMEGIESKIGFWYSQLTYNYHKLQNWPRAVEYGKKWLTSGYNKYDALAELAVMHNMNRNFSDAIACSDSILSNEQEILRLYGPDTLKTMLIYGCVEKGFGMLFNGKIRQALPVLERSFLLDSNWRFARFTYSNALALNGKLDESRRHHDVCLTLLKNPQDFGYMLNDWAMFVENGNLDEFFTAEKVRLSKIYNEKYRYRLLIDSIFNVGYYLRKNQGDEEGALKNFQRALKICHEKLPNDSSKLQFMLDWCGYVASNLNQDSLALGYYQEATDLCEKYHFPDDQLLYEYDNISFSAKKTERWDIYRKYTIKNEELKTKIREQKRKRLFVLSAATNKSAETSITEKYAENDAVAFYKSLEENAVKHFDTVLHIEILGTALTFDSLNHTFKRVVDRVQENDVFLFYYAGPTREDDKYAQLNLADDYFKVNELAGYLTQIKSTKQILLFDGGNMSVDSVNNYLKDYSPGYKENSVFFMTNKNWRSEGDNKHGILTGAMLNYLKYQNSDPTISAQSLMNGTIISLNNIGNAYGIQAITRGYEITLGRKKLDLHGMDTVPPKVDVQDATIVRSDNLLVKSGRKTDLTGFVTDNQGIQIVFVNGKEVSLAGNGRFSLPFNSLKSDTVNIVAIDLAGNKTSITAIVERPRTSSVISSRRIAFMFANDTFDKWNHLNNPVFDAQEVGSILRDYYGYDVHYVFDEDVDGVRNGMDEMTAMHFAPGDQLLVYYASHGYLHPSRGLLIAAKDAEDPKGGKFRNFIAGTDLMYAIQHVSCNNVFLFMDVCYSGSMANNENVIDYRQPVSKRGLSDPTFIQTQLSIRCSEFMISGRSNPVYDGVRGSHSPFAATIIQNLMKGASGTKAYVCLEDLKADMKQTGTNADWRPVYGYWDREPDGEFLFEVVKRASAPAAMKIP